MLEYLQQLTYWHWWVLGLGLFILEMLGIGGFLIGIASAALVVGLLTLVGILPNWQIELLAFSTLSVAFTVLYWKYFRRDRNTDPASSFNQRGLAYVGRRFKASTAVSNGHGRLQFGDTFWEVSSKDDIAEDENFLVESVEGMTLVIKKENEKE